MDGTAPPALYGILADYDVYFQQLLAKIAIVEETWPVQLVNKYMLRAEKDLPVPKQVFNPGPDPRTENWPLANPGLPVLIVLGYIALVLTLKPIVGALFPKLKLRGAVLLHNVFAAGMSAYMVYESYTTFDEIYGAKSLLTSSRWSHEIDNIDSDRSKWSTTAAHRLASILFVHYIMKIYELADTFIMIFKQNWRQVSFLHVYHHASVIFPTWYFNVLYYPGAEAWFCCFLNSLVHVIMYSYYGCQTVGIKMPFKSLITVMQIVQFCLYLWQSGYMVFFAPADKAKPLIAAWQLLIQASIFLYLFSQFFYRTYIRAAPKAKTA